MALIHFWPPKSGPGLRLLPTYVLPLLSHMGPLLKVQHTVKEYSIPVNCRRAQHAPVDSLSAAYNGSVLSFSPHACAGPIAAVVGDEEVGLPGEISGLKTLSSPSRSWPHIAWSPSLHQRLGLSCAKSSTSFCACQQLE
jgi:hypothetical protein